MMVPTLCSINYVTQLYIIYMFFLKFVLVAFSSESSLCIFTILFKMVCLAAVAYSATVNTVVTIKM